MSIESSEWLNNNILVGFTDKRGHAWHYKESSQGAEPNHYPGPVPIPDIIRRLFNFQALESDIYVPVEGDFRPVPGRKAILASDNGDVLGVHGASYRPHQYDEWLLNNVSNILDDDLAVGSAGLLSGRAKAWVQIESPDNIEGPAGVSFRPHLLAATSFDGTLATTYKATCTVVVCDNTLDAGLRGDGSQLKIRHSSQSIGRISDAREALGIIFQAADDFSKEIEELTSIKVSEDAWQRILDKLIPKESGKRSIALADNKRLAIDKLWATDERVSPWKNTAWGVLQAFNTYDHHYQHIKGKPRVERNLVADLTGRRTAHDAKVLQVIGAVA